jgi:hypothetical protein
MDAVAVELDFLSDRALMGTHVYLIEVLKMSRSQVVQAS